MDGKNMQAQTKAGLYSTGGIVMVGIWLISTARIDAAEDALTCFFNRLPLGLCYVPDFGDIWGLWSGVVVLALFGYVIGASAYAYGRKAGINAKP